MARKMKKFAEGGSSKYDERYKRKLADIEKDYAKASKGKTGKAADVAKAKYDQRMADAKDDLAKWTKSDRTQTRAAEKSAERNLSMTRKYGAVKSATEKDVGETARVSAPTDVVKAPSIDRSFTSKASAAKPKTANKQTPKAPPAQPKRMGDQGFAYKSKTTDGRPAMQGIRGNAEKLVAERKAKEKAQANWRNVRGGSNSGAGKSDAGKSKVLSGSTGTRDNTAAGRRERMGKALSYLNPFSYIENKAQRLDPSEMAKGGSVKKPMPKEGATGGGSTVPMTPERKAFMKRMQDEEAASKKGVKPNPSKYAKGGSMKKYAKGGSVDGCAKKGKTKAKMVKMAAGGSTGLARAAAMSGRTMPTGKPAATGTARASAMSGRTFKKGGKMGGCK